MLPEQCHMWNSKSSPVPRWRRGLKSNLWKLHIVINKLRYYTAVFFKYNGFSNIIGLAGQQILASGTR